MNEFIIDFSFQGVVFKGLVRPETEDGRDAYNVKLESENQETNEVSDIEGKSAAPTSEKKDASIRLQSILKK